MKAAFFFCIVITVVSFIGIAPSGARAQQDNTKPLVESGHTGILLQMGRRPLGADSAAFGVMDSVTAAKWMQRLQGGAAKAPGTGSDQRAFLEQLVKQAQEASLGPGSPPLRVRTEARPGNRLAVLVENVSAEPLSNVRINTTYLPEDWQVVSESSKLEHLPPGRTGLITLQLSSSSGLPSSNPRRVGLNMVTDNGLSLGWSARVTLVRTAEEGIPPRFEVHSNYPNPFISATTISYSLPRTMTVRVEVYTILGQRVAVLVDAEQQPGIKNITWDASRMASGTYLYRVIAEAADGEQFVSERKMVLVK